MDERIDRLLTGLNQRQREAVTSTEGYIRIIAGAGSGKTKALTSRYAYIVEGLGISPSNILCVTFTNKAAQEMRNRVRSLVGEGKDSSYITTYHGFCVQVIREDCNKILYPRDFIIMDKEDQKTILREIYKELNISIKELTFKQALIYICLKKSDLGYIEKLVDPSYNLVIDPKTNKKERVFISYLKKQNKSFALDFDDLINFVLYIFRNHKDVLKKWQERLHYIQVDETQDSSDNQFELVRILSDRHKNLFVVGDPDQTIYEWRGAKPEILVDFDKQFPSSKTVIMDENYRSTPDILSVGNSLIKNNKLRVEKEMFTQKHGGVKVVHFHGKNETEEGLWIVNIIKGLREDKVPLRDIAILYRANYVSRYIEQALIKENIEYEIYGGVRFFERKEIKDALAYLRLISCEDDFSFLRVINEPKRGLGKVFIQTLKQKAEEENFSLYKCLLKHIEDKAFCKKGTKEFISLIELSQQKRTNLSISDLLQFVLEESEIKKNLRSDGDTDRIDNIKELISSILLYEKENGDDATLENYLQEIALFTNMDYKEDKDLVKLMTIHTSKGLEYPYVFLCGFSEGILPSYMSLKERKGRALEEERRLTYVAFTRAMTGLYITESEGFNYNTGSKYPSRFLFEIRKELLINEGNLNGELIEESKRFIEKNTFGDSVNECVEQINVGDMVSHPIWNTGKVISVDSDKEEYLIEFVDSKLVKPINFSYNLLKKKTFSDFEYKEEKRSKDGISRKSLEEKNRRERKEYDAKLRVAREGKRQSMDQTLETQMREFKDEEEQVKKQDVEMGIKQEEEIIEKQKSNTTWIKIKKFFRSPF